MAILRTDDESVVEFHFQFDKLVLPTGRDTESLMS